MPQTVQHSLVQLLARLVFSPRNVLAQHFAGRSCHWFFPTCQASGGRWARAHVGPHKDDPEQVVCGRITTIEMLSVLLRTSQPTFCMHPTFTSYILQCCHQVIFTGGA